MNRNKDKEHIRNHCCTESGISYYCIYLTDWKLKNYK